jgi:lipopolysaccharide/colanic/teichoic acid biosynthesis glycosyltransferase
MLSPMVAESTLVRSWPARAALAADGHAAVRKRERRLLRAGLLLTDVLALALAVSLAGGLRLVMDSVLPVATLGYTDRHAVASILVVPLLLLLFWASGRYDLDHSLVGPREYAQIVHAVTYGVVIALAVSYFAGGEPLISRSWLLLVWLFSSLCVGLGRFTLRRLIRMLRRRGALRTRVVIVGASSCALELAEQFRAGQGEGIDVVGFLDEYLPMGQELLPGAPVLGRPGDLGARVRREVDEYILVPQALPHERLEEITHLMVSREGPVMRMAVNSSDLLTHGLQITERNNVPLVTLRRARLTGLDVVLKRGLDIVVALVGLGVMLPVVLVALVRARLAGVPRLLYPEPVYAAGGGKASLWLLDPAVSPWLPLRGAPGLVSVLSGQFTLVGPRPVAWRPDEPVLPAVWVTAIQPGLIGPWRLSGPHATLDDQALQDLTYVRNYSIWEDVRILWQSLARLAGPVGARLGRWQDLPAQRRAPAD